MQLSGLQRSSQILKDIRFKEDIAKCDHLNKLKFSRTNPYAFTEHGTIMLASVLNTSIAIETSVLIVRAFVKLRELLYTHMMLLLSGSCL